MTNLIKKLKSIIFSLIIFLCLFSLPVDVYASIDEAIFAGGCFWCLEHDLEDLNGVISAQSGYSGGEMKKPTYQNHKGHQESVLVKFDTSEISYEKLLQNFWINIDPFDGDGQFCDRGDSYKPVIFANGIGQMEMAKKSFNAVAKDLDVNPSDLKVEIKQSGKFWIAERYHQDFAKKNNLKYNFYRFSCGRDKRLADVWPK